MQGLILLNKPQDITSFKAVSSIKRIAGEKRVGHTGTLDPMATGVLPILLGRATALSSLMLDAEKRYTARIRLGITTDTDDITGEIMEQQRVNVSNEELSVVLKSFCGKIQQIPPIYSALKRDGIRLYELARQGKTIDIEPRSIEIFEIALISPLSSINEFVIDTYVSKGTYIRALARDIGEKLGCGATLTELKRTYASGFDISQCVELNCLSEENVSQYLLSEEAAVAHLREISITEKQAVRFCNGGQLGFERIKIEKINDSELFRVKFNQKLLGIGFADTEKQQIGIKCILNYL